MASHCTQCPKSVQWPRKTMPDLTLPLSFLTHSVPPTHPSPRCSSHVGLPCPKHTKLSPTWGPCLSCFPPSLPGRGSALPVCPLPRHPSSGPELKDLQEASLPASLSGPSSCSLLSQRSSLFEMLVVFMFDVLQIQYHRLSGSLLRAQCV